jgi:hypothetical protein
LGVKIGRKKDYRVVIVFVGGIGYIRKFIFNYASNNGNNISGSQLIACLEK